MKQSTLDRFGIILEQRPRTGLSFFDLPLNVRCRVYEHAGLYRTCPIDLNYKPKKEDTDSEDDTYNDDDEEYYWSDADGLYQCYVRKYFTRCDCEPLPWGLICASREASRLFYSHNRFKVCQGWPGGLLALHNMRPETLSNLRTLAIRVNFCLSPPGRYPCYTTHHFPDSRPLKHIASRHEKWMLADWKRLCKRLVQHVRPGRLRLSFICDTEEIETAKIFLAPLETISTLSQCAIRLSREPVAELQRLADETVVRLSTPRVAPFRFTDLPAELQTRVLSHTDLVAPYAIEWSLDAGYGPWQDMMEPEECFMCIDVGETCCITLENASLASQCNCWKIPKALFCLDSRTRDEALRIFYKGNHIIIPYAYGPRLDLAPFLFSVPRHARRYLRSIQFEFPDPRHMYRGSKVSQALAAAVAILVADADLPRLTITIDVSAGWTTEEDTEMNESMSEARWVSYKQMILPMYLFAGRLKDFFVHLPWFYLGSDPVRRREREQDLERRIMASERYDSIQRGKFDRPRTWSTYGGNSRTQYRRIR